jgi:exosortase/archaeosortase family protein
MGKAQGSKFQVEQFYNRVAVARKAVVSCWKDPKYQFLRDVFWFVVITLVIHYSYRFWAQDMHFWPVKVWMMLWQDWLAQLVYDQSTWVDQHILGLDVVKEGRMMQFDNGSAIRINRSCSGDKQLLQLALLLLVFPGKWYRKCWFIPLGVILVHATNVIRIALLSLVAVWKPSWIGITHDVLLRGIFYVVIFLVWLWFIHIKSGKTNHSNRA